MRRNSNQSMGKVRAKNKPRKTEATMNDPPKRANVMQLINTERDAIEDKQQEVLKGRQLRSKFVIERPMALLRRRAPQGRKATPSPMVPFGRLLEKVVAFVDVRSENEDGSDEVKALLKNMGATVVEHFGRNVTHVIFQDGSVLTYQKAKRTKKHLVSVLWLETIQTTGRRVPEGSYLAQDRGMTTFISRFNWLFSADKSKSPDSLFPQESDSESDCGMVDGRPYKKRKFSTILSDDSEKLYDLGGSSEPDKTTVKIDSSMQSKSNDGDASSILKTIEPQTESNDIIVSSEDASKDSVTKKPKKRALCNLKNHAELLNMADEEEIVTTIKTRDGFKIPDKRNSPIPTDATTTKNEAKEGRLSMTSSKGQLSFLKISDECNNSKQSLSRVGMSPLDFPSFSSCEPFNNSDSIAKLIASLDSPDEWRKMRLQWNEQKKFVGRKTRERDDSLPIKPQLNRRSTMPRGTSIKLIARLDSPDEWKKMRLQGNEQKKFVGRKTRARDDSLPIKPQLNRRSTMPRGTSTPNNNVKAVAEPSTIVCTRFHWNNVLEFQEIVKKLGGFTVENNVTERTSHLVALEATRTINILRAIARGIWILRSEWLYASMESGKWLPEEDYELTNFSPAVQQCRIERERFGSRYSMDVFANCGPIYVARSTKPPYADLEGLIILGKGTVANNRRNAAICVGEVLRTKWYEHVACVSEVWVLDSVMSNVYKPVDQYILEKPKPTKSKHV